MWYYICKQSKKFGKIFTPEKRHLPESDRQNAKKHVFMRDLSVRKGFLEEKNFPKNGSKPPKIWLEKNHPENTPRKAP